MEFITVAQEKALNHIPGIKASNQAKAKGKFPKRRFTAKDVLKLLHNRNKIKHTLQSVLQTAGVIKAHSATATDKTQITQSEFQQLDAYIRNDLGMDSWGVATFAPHEIFQGDAIPYANVIVMSRHMENSTFQVAELPNMDCMLEVMKVYGDTGVACLRATKWLRERHFGAVPNHSLGGNIDYTKAGYKANLGFIGKHGMLITPHSGPCNRLSVVYTSIENLNDFLQNNQDHTWGSAFCNSCHNCVRKCPHGAIYDVDQVDENSHVTSISNPKCGSGFAHYGCAICIAACPFTKISYEKLKERASHP